MAKLFDSWRGETRSTTFSNPPLGSDEARRIARDRIQRMEIGELMDWIEVNLGGIGRNMRDWRGTGNPDYVLEAIEASTINLFAVQELARRTR